MFRFRKLSIKYKLMLVVILTTSLGLVISVASMVVYDREKQREILSEEMTVLTQVIASRSAAALSFNDEIRATENLAALLFRRSIVSACMFGRSGRLFAKALAADAPVQCEAQPRPEGWYFEGGYLVVSQPVILNRQRIGTVVVRTDLSDLDRRLTNQVIANALILILALFAALLLTSRLQRMIYQPIISLGEVAHKVTFDGNYSTRASTTNEDEIGETVHAFNAMLTRIEQDKKQLTAIAYYDTLTMLPNRRSFTERLEKLLEDASSGVSEGRVGIIFVDLDRFKQVNDTLGHDVGDLFLQSCARRLESAMPANGTAFRLAGDEFTVLQTDIVREEDLAATARRILENFEPPFNWPGGKLNMSASIGGALSEASDDASSLLKKADLAVYRAKDEGRNNYQFYARR